MNNEMQASTILATDRRININPHTRQALQEGFRDGIPIALGYFAVAFTLGIAAKNSGLTAFQGLLASLLNNASAGQYAGFALIAAGSTYLEIALVTLITNARYLLMSCALSQKLSPDTPLHHRLLLGYDITDELFGISIAQKGYLNPYYTFGAVLIAIPAWAFGTYLGVIAGNILPLRAVSALSVALYSMFLAVIIPPARKNKVVAALVAISFLISFLAVNIPVFSAISSGTRTILLTVIIAAIAAVLFPILPQKEASENEQ